MTPQAEPILELFRGTGAYLEGHFRLTSGLHSGEYLQCALVLQYPAHAEALGRLLAGELRTKVGRDAASAFTYIFNMTGQPAATVPCGFTKAGLPIGLQIVGRRFDDVTVLRASAAFEAAHPWAQRRPAIGSR